ncbi:nucleotide sugar dehydrogenase [Sedimentitalea sp. JM2-8]|uniref:Nucleotide sugar dehydrogenase n=1 Tax=Sedimentitalea xiamensis TaxID=3050037 RepID=A0ABT7FI81_9RHOB|nr:nucleotide sugar dehydrogenase [Sedimentitalea xiamensis]MDK3074846.1 nucleotide sugar dehydrogenase [Sedimentitalea xiamensis]
MRTRASRDLIEKLRSGNARIGVIGLGYVGLPLAVTCAKRGLATTGFDIDPAKMLKLDALDSYIEAVDSQDISQLHRAGTLDWTTDFGRLAAMDIIVICVPTPLSRTRDPDLSFVIGTTETIAAHITANTLVVLESTTYPGTTVEIVKPVLEKSGLVCGQDIFVGFSPEREDPGNANYRTATIPKIVAGDGADALEVMTAFYEIAVDSVIPVSNTQTAEAVKITENIFRAVNIALVNELKVVFDAMGIDIWEVIDGAATKPFGFMPFYPGPGLGGHCIPIDPFYLTWKAREFDLSTRFIELAGEINSAMPHYVVDRLRRALDRSAGIGLSRSRILIIGIAYKKNVSDMRESPSVRLMDLLMKEGANVDFLDPHVPEIPAMREYPHLKGKRSIDPRTLAESGHDAILISTDHDAIDYAALIDLGVPIIDTRNAIERRNLPGDHVVKA